MPTYNVHLYREMRLFFPGIPAGTHEEAAQTAAQKPDADAAYIDECEGATLAALVDVVGDADFAHSRMIGFATLTPKGDDSDMNTKRAARASAALAAFCGITGQNTTEETEEAMSDLLCDLLHLAKAKGFDPQTMLTRAVGHYEHEVLYPEDERMTERRV